MKIYYNPKLKQLARNLRNNSTLSEVLLWNQLKGKKMMGYQFNRQRPILDFIVDFICPKLNLVIEIDGWSHIGKEAEDKERQKKIENLGITFLRFDDRDVKTNMDGVYRVIIEWIVRFEVENGRQI
ncbi:MAG: endonuclease domain-containing protein [Candidatus Marinimicrobia bacterium]|jgi:very-short-patch-repair endonuclease|nr:endonuclease domain-containing protein [Candidatus Neomarinimicrobiota bacterium]MBT3848684.1 endonuclease domain-containing protein [Candidatus Neomarinimicrobiota bacterium]MBT4054453.1 endonuclease domain-containing protein [Candidatus Neomarinimicrobiota bacterium]MBT4753642.1 endonuclease domain-containing protein [Candidatus Neomarinimicrobiota bacterium]MBT5115596.1 endonuclease domain-containing protein [Candidatus Neomarinimicrobiota bacterium]